MMLGSQAITRATQIDIAVARYARPRVRSIINGFWRSGTTWVQESMANVANAKTIFEPLSAAGDTAKDIFNQFGIVDPAIQQACIPGPDLMSHPTMLAHLDASFYGMRWDQFQRLCRRGVLESTRRRIIVKGVRLHSALSMLARRYRAPIVHVRRHPCAVISSLARVKWGWSFDDVRLPKLFEHSLAGCTAEIWHRADIAIRNFDGDTVSRLAAYWAMVELIAEREVAETASARIVWYEDLMDDPRQSIRDLCAYCGLTAKRSFDHERDSAVTSEATKSINPANRRNVWRTQLAGEDVGKIIRIINEIAPEVKILPQIRMD